LGLGFLRKIEKLELGLGYRREREEQEDRLTKETSLI